jgi:hypothetical protein
VNGEDEIMRHIYIIFIGILFVLAAFFNQPANAGDEHVFYKVVISEEVMNNPHALSAWREYAKFKKEWREDLFFKTFSGV